MIMICSCGTQKMNGAVFFYLHQAVLAQIMRFVQKTFISLFHVVASNSLQSLVCCHTLTSPSFVQSFSDIEQWCERSATNQTNQLRYMVDQPELNLRICTLPFLYLQREIKNCRKRSPPCSASYVDLLSANTY